jgi:hypothetical protein
VKQRADLRRPFARRSPAGNVREEIQVAVVPEAAGNDAREVCAGLGAAGRIYADHDPLQGGCALDSRLLQVLQVPERPRNVEQQLPQQLLLPGAGAFELADELVEELRGEVGAVVVRAAAGDDHAVLSVAGDQLLDQAARLWSGGDHDPGLRSDAQRQQQVVPRLRIPP